jgi:hypothetical protein
MLTHTIRRISIPLLLCGGVVLSASSVMAQGVPAWRSNFQRWQQQTRERNGQWRVQSNATRQQGRGVVDLLEGDAEPGNYDVRLPFGVNLRVNVPENQRRENARPQQTIDSVVVSGEQIRQGLHTLRWGVRRAGMPELQDSTGKAIEQIEQVIASARGDVPLNTILEQAERFDSTWHGIERQISANKNAGQWLQRQSQQIGVADERLHRVIQISPARGYNRVETVAVARRLSDLSDELFENLREESSNSLSYHRMIRQVAEARRQSKDLYRAVHNGESFESVTSEYEQFDRAWHELVEMARNNDDLSRRVWKQGREINQLDLRLHELLQVESPLVNSGQRTISTVHTLAKSAANLSAYVQNSRLDGVQKQSLLREARDVAQNTDDFHEWLERGNQSHEEEHAWVNEINEQWSDFERRASTLDAQQHKDLLELSRQFEQVLQRVNEQVNS